MQTRSHNQIQNIVTVYDTVLKESSISYPQLFAQHDQTLIFEYIEGKILSLLSYETRKMDDHIILKQVIESLVKINKIQTTTKRPFRRGMFKTMVRNVWKLSFIKLLSFDIRTLQFLLSILRCIYFSPKQFSHGDFHMGNIIYNSTTNSTTIIDWETWDQLPISFDIARLLQHYSIEDKDKLLKHYQQHMNNLKLNTAIEKNFWIFTLLLSLRNSKYFHKTEEFKVLKSRIEDITSQ